LFILKTVSTITTITFSESIIVELFC
jgi:hypothetical protein